MLSVTFQYSASLPFAMRYMSTAVAVIFLPARLNPMNSSLWVPV